MVNYRWPTLFWNVARPIKCLNSWSSLGFSLSLSLSFSLPLNMIDTYTVHLMSIQVLVFAVQWYIAELHSSVIQLSSLKRDFYVSVLLSSHTNTANWAVEESNIWNSILISLNRLVTVLLHILLCMYVLHVTCAPLCAWCVSNNAHSTCDAIFWHPIESIQYQVCPAFMGRSWSIGYRSVVLSPTAWWRSEFPPRSLSKRLLKLFRFLFPIPLINPKTDSYIYT